MNEAQMLFISSRIILENMIIRFYISFYAFQILLLKQKGEKTNSNSEMHFDFFFYFTLKLLYQ